MTNEEASSIIEVMLINSTNSILRRKALEKAMAALEKRIPKMPTYELQSKFFGTVKRICPVCGDVVVIFPTAKKSERFCRYCGVRLS